ncbi:MULTISPECIES: DNA gyrase subunit A [unclassified Psychrobacter]|uniref:DNA gyrase subunit A n=1 Tax=unclassified Psychrobacter TaxID=196806 RepID=UPI00070F16BF|nr:MULTISPECIES: DNA gyrase subunit A [unclassified Psychrobacter]KRG36367.1 DNA gyrase subunit A [Psychrobacter sp. P11G3]MBA6243912.1 DNA gyrase subunit A [Psychrobacter sp. Urea-trap-18]MBA6285495.1 DNA gyrase subunit A [Psychrobacter sp. Urea-trap-16]MBA6318985.1 DNA gyrase subunit A [Psychrobacter sp. Urea-trap-20]MBA6335004.1 DNA gyrase subunit A [Psychrobacter sp. Urea-trap-19]
MSESVSPIGIVDELKQSYLDYAMSVIVSRALPDVRDGFKPVHRRVMYAMHVLSNDYNKPYKKSARVVGDVIGKYHPHGDSAVYDAIVRMAQDFSLRYPMVDGQGNFGSIDDDPPAAMRYTEVRMTKLTHQMLADLDKDTVDWEDNYDGSERMPSVMPARIPNLLVNGATGIAVGMATNMAPHNLTEVINACLAYAENPQVSAEELMSHISGPDFPTGGIIYGRAGILDAYRTGKGRLHIRGRYHIEPMSNSGVNRDRERIVFTEVPYQANKAKLIERIAELVRDKKIEGISEIRDESDKDGMRIAIDLRRGETAEVIVNNLFLQTPLESSFSINMVALDNGQPKLLTLRQLIAAFVRHRQEVVTRRTIYELNKARVRGHLLEGLTVALANIDEIIATIKASANRGLARESLLNNTWGSGSVVAMLTAAGSQSVRPEFIDGEDPKAPFGLIEGEERYRLSLEQVNAILDMQLHRLTGLEQDKLTEEYQDLLREIAHLESILGDFDKLMAIISNEMIEIRDNFGDERRTDIIDSRMDFSREDLIPEQTVVMTVSRTGYAKTQPIDDYVAQKRGGKGKSATAMKEDDVIDHLVVTSTHSTVLCFTDSGRVFSLRGFEVPIASRGARGRPLVNLIGLNSDETVTTILPIPKIVEDTSVVSEVSEVSNDDDSVEDSNQAEPPFVFFATANGTVKRVELKQFANIRSNGLIAVGLEDGDKLVSARITNGSQEVMLFASSGKAIRFDENDARAMGRTAKGVRGMRLATDEFIKSLVVIEDDVREILIACENGFGKRTFIDEFNTQNRGGGGVIAIKTSERNGALVRATKVDSTDDIILISDKGTLVRTPVEHVASSGRNTQGVTLIRLSKDEKLVAMARVEHEESDDELIDAMREDGTFEVEGQEQIDIDATTDNTATTDVDDVIDIANDHKPSDNL